MPEQGDTRDCPECQDGTKQTVEIAPDPNVRTQGIYPKSVLMWRCPKNHTEAIK